MDRLLRRLGVLSADVDSVCSADTLDALVDLVCSNVPLPHNMRSARHIGELERSARSGSNCWRTTNPFGDEVSSELVDARTRLDASAVLFKSRISEIQAAVEGRVEAEPRTHTVQFGQSRRAPIVTLQFDLAVTASSVKKHLPYGAKISLVGGYSANTEGPIAKLSKPLENLVGALWTLRFVIFSSIVYVLSTSFFKIDMETSVATAVVVGAAIPLIQALLPDSSAATSTSDSPAQQHSNRAQQQPRSTRPRKSTTHASKHNTRPSQPQPQQKQQQQQQQQSKSSLNHAVSSPSRPSLSVRCRPPTSSDNNNDDGGAASSGQHHLVADHNDNEWLSASQRPKATLTELVSFATSGSRLCVACGRSLDVSVPRGDNTCGSCRAAQRTAGKGKRQGGKGEKRGEKEVEEGELHAGGSRVTRESFRANVATLVSAGYTALMAERALAQNSGRVGDALNDLVGLGEYVLDEQYSAPKGHSAPVCDSTLVKNTTTSALTPKSKQYAAPTGPLTPEEEQAEHDRKVAMFSELQSMGFETSQIALVVDTARTLDDAINRMCNATTLSLSDMVAGVASPAKGKGKGKGKASK